MVKIEILLDNPNEVEMILAVQEVADFLRRTNSIWYVNAPPSALDCNVKGTVQVTKTWKDAQEGVVNKPRIAARAPICTCGDTLGDIDPRCGVHFPSRA